MHEFGNRSTAVDLRQRFGAHAPPVLRTMVVSKTLHVGPRGV